MAPVFDFASSLSGTAVSQLTFSHTCSGTNRYICVGAGNYRPSTQNINTVTFNGVALSEVYEAQAAQNLAYWELVNPDATTANVVVTWSAAADEIAAGAVSCTNVHQTTPRRGTYAIANGSSTTATVNIASNTDDLVIDMVVWDNPNGITGGASQTERWSREDVDGYSSYGQSTEPGAATTTMSWTAVASNAWRIFAASLQSPAAGGDVYSGRGVGRGILRGVMR